MPPDRVSIAVIGIGGIGAVHATNLAAGVDRATLAYVVDRDEDLARSMGARLGVQWSTTVEDLLDRPNPVDAVLIATPPTSHASLIELAATAGKHVFCEKPLAVDLDAGLKACEAIDAAGVCCQLGFQRRFDREFVELKRAAESAGRVYQYHGSMRDMDLGDGAQLGGVPSLIESTCHEFDAARWLVGEIVEVSASGTYLSDPRLAEHHEPDNTIISVRFENGAIGSIETSRVAGYGFDCRAEILAVEATLRVGQHLKSGVERLDRSRPGFTWPRNYLERFSECYPTELGAFARRVIEGGRPDPDAMDGLAALQLSLASLESLQAGRPVAVPPPASLRSLKPSASAGRLR